MVRLAQGRVPSDPPALGTRRLLSSLGLPARPEQPALLSAVRSRPESVLPVAVLGCPGLQRTSESAPSLTVACWSLFPPCLCPFVLRFPLLGCEAPGWPPVSAPQGVAPAEWSVPGLCRGPGGTGSAEAVCSTRPGAILAPREVWKEAPGHSLREQGPG